MANFKYRLKKVENKVKKNSDYEEVDYEAKAKRLMACIEKFKKMDNKEFFSYPESNPNMEKYEKEAWEIAHGVRTGELACQLCSQQDIYPYLLALGFDVVPSTS